MKIHFNKTGFEQKTGLLIFIGVFLIALFFAAYTNHIWEDYYITYRVSKNLATGHGLVYTIGEKVHAFTSPLNVLFPAVMLIITGNSSDTLVLWLFRILSCALLGIAAVLLFNTARKNSLTLIPVALLVGMFAMDTKIIDFSINGQEIAFMMLFLALTLNALTVRSRWTVLKLGLAWAGLMWTRPDGFIYIAVIAISFLIFNAGQSIADSRLGLLKIFFKAGILAGILYLPWFLWAWHYYGSPIPYTIIAKGYSAKGRAFDSISPRHLGTLLLNFLTFPLRMLLGYKSTTTVTTFMPTYYFLGGWHYAVFIFSNYLSYICALYWCLPFGRPQARAVSFAFMMSHFYLSHIAAYDAPWYVPNCTILAIFVFAYFMQQGLNLASFLKDKAVKISLQLTRFIHILTASALITTLLLTLCSAYQLRIQQRLIEDGNRKKIGLWLQAAASTSDTVFLEPLGYIGFFSKLKMLDYPGLCAPEVVAAQKKLQSRSWDKLIPQLHPDWLVLRPREIDSIHQIDPLLLTQRYSAFKTFDVSERVKSYRWLPGRGYLAYDQTFIVFKLNKDDTAGQNNSIEAVQP
jgi:hypothetical protein